MNLEEPQSVEIGLLGNSTQDQANIIPNEPHNSSDENNTGIMESNNDIVQTNATVTTIETVGGDTVPLTTQPNRGRSATQSLGAEGVVQQIVQVTPVAPVGLVTTNVSSTSAVIMENQTDENKTDDESEDECEEYDIWQDSIHKYFVLPHLNGGYCILSLLIVLIQFTIYFVLFNQALRQINLNLIPVVMDKDIYKEYYYGKEENVKQAAFDFKKHLYYYDNNITKLYGEDYGKGFGYYWNFYHYECSYDEALPIWTILPAILLSFHTMPDVFSSIMELLKIFNKNTCVKSSLIQNIWSIIACFIIILESLLALVCGIAWAYEGYYFGNTYNSIINCVGILFVHDIDEKAFEIIKRINIKLFKCKLCKNDKNFINKHLKVILIILSILVTVAITLYFVLSGAVEKAANEGPEDD